MREIKFRCLFEQERDLGNFLRWEYVGVNEKMDNLLQSCLIQKSPWLQFTGLKDVLEKEIYEGDIGNVDDKMGQIRYESDFGGYIFEWRYSKNQHHLLLTCDVALDFAVLGNIYENPELLNNEPNVQGSDTTEGE